MTGKIYKRPTNMFMTGVTFRFVKVDKVDDHNVNYHYVDVSRQSLGMLSKHEFLKKYKPLNRLGQLYHEF
jgi:hypothetical protein